MAKRKKNKRSNQESPTGSSSAPFNNPFGSLGALRDTLPQGPPPRPEEQRRPEVPAASDGLESCGKLVVSQEKKGRVGKTVTRIRGLSPAAGEEVAAAIKSALGCGAAWENEDLVLLGALADRAQQYLEESGARRVVVSGGAPRSEFRRSGSSSPKVKTGGGVQTADGTRRADLRAGMTVDIVLKADQSTGELTRGEIQQILTKSPQHPHGIKVRLADGRVGRVKAVIED